MNKKLFTIMFVAIFLIASIGFVSASDDAKNISVKLVWDDNGNDVAKPDAVTVNLILDGKVVDTAKLSDSNSWKTAFKNLDPNEDYTITVDDISGFTLKTSKDGESGFIITGIAQESVLGASDDQATVSGDDDPATGDNPVVPPTTGDDPSSDEDGTQTGDNGTDDSDNETAPTGNATNITANQPTSKKTTVVKKVVKKETKPVKKTNNKLKDTGLPIALVLIAIACIFIPIARKK